MPRKSSKTESHGGLLVEQLAMPLANLSLSVRAATQLALANVHTVGQLIATPELLLESGPLPTKIRKEVLGVLRDDHHINVEVLSSDARAQVSDYVDTQPFKMEHFDAYVKASVGSLNAQRGRNSSGIELADLERSLLPGCVQALVDSNFDPRVFDRIRSIFTAAEAWYSDSTGREQRHLLPAVFQISFMEALITYFALRDEE